MWTGKKDRGRGTAIGVVQDQLSPLLWVALYLPQNPKTRSSTEIAIKIAADGFMPNKKTLVRKVALPLFASGSLASGNPAGSYSSGDCPAHFASCAQAQ